MKRFLTLLFVCLLPLSALAEPAQTYTLSPANVNEQALHDIAFGEKAKDAAQDQSRSYMFYQLTPEGLPFDLLQPVLDNNQMRIYASRQIPEGVKDLRNLSKDVEPTGIARLTLTREEAVKKAEAAMQKLGLTDYVLQSVTAYGHKGFSLPCYRVAFGQTHEGKPLYWQAAIQNVWADTDSNRILIDIDDTGILTISGYWSKLNPSGKKQESISMSKALEQFKLSGIDADTAEACYLLCPDKPAIAVPAWRYQNAFVHAVTGQRLQ